MVGGYYNSNVEVFDSCSNKFALFKHSSANLSFENVSNITTLGNTILFFTNFNGSVLTYNVENGEWVEKMCDATKHIKCFSCAKIPQH